MKLEARLTGNEREFRLMFHSSKQQSAAALTKVFLRDQGLGADDNKTEVVSHGLLHGGLICLDCFEIRVGRSSRDS